ncbi:MAG: imidazole glycerol phosphate synthase subunit HisF [Thermanaerothrix sp.]|nr:imidazole glycerol phosphate synthase subunit HisF [Thermanaerothrix sp.]
MGMIRIIPCLDVKDGRVVKGVGFEGLKDSGDPAEMGERYCLEGADELVFLDITASYEARSTRLEWVLNVAKVMTIPFSVGGGISSEDQAVELVRLGADKISVNSAAVMDPGLIGRCALRLGSQAVVVAVDAKRTQGGFRVFIKGGREDTGMDMAEWVSRLEGLGAGEVLLTSIDRDGTAQGYDLEMIRLAREATKLPIIASGGAGTPKHFAEAAEAGADGLLAASVFHYGAIKIPELKDMLKGLGVPVRI